MDSEYFRAQAHGLVWVQNIFVHKRTRGLNFLENRVGHSPIDGLIKKTVETDASRQNLGTGIFGTKFRRASLYRFKTLSCTGARACMGSEYFRAQARGLVWIQNTFVHRRAGLYGFKSLSRTGARACMGSEYFRAQARGLVWVQNTFVHRRAGLYGIRIVSCTGAGASMVSDEL